MMNKLLLSIAFLLSVGANAQVTIGSEQAPKPGSLLDLKNLDVVGDNGETATKGLGLPRVQLTDLNRLKMGETTITDNPVGRWAQHTGLMVYNINKRESTKQICPGIHIWDGNKWVSIIPYPVFANTERMISKEIISFKFLDVNSDDDWPADKNRLNYPLGYIGKIQDNRDPLNGETYTYTRFYVGLVVAKETYEQKTSNSCDANNPKYKTTIVERDAVEYFEDGVWMTQSMRATSYDPIRDDSKEAISVITPLQNAPAEANNWTTWNYVDEDPSLKHMGLLYSGATALNAAANPERVFDTGRWNKDSEKVQGICPTGWYIPSIREFTDLYNAIAINASLFSTEADYAGPLLGYVETDTDPSFPHKAHQSLSISGTSNLPEQGGFNAEGAGMYCWDPPVWSYRDRNFYITSNNSKNWRTWGQFNSISASLEKRLSDYLSTVRCKKR